MRNILLGIAVAIAAAPGLALAATAQVEFVKPEGFTDAGHNHAERGRIDVPELLRRHIVRQAGKLLPPEQSLAVTISDVDLAGSIEPNQPAASSLRIVRDMYPPRIDLTFRLSGTDGKAISEGKRTLRDTSFLQRGTPDNGDILRYEKRMLDDWMKTEFGVRR